MHAQLRQKSAVLIFFVFSTVTIGAITLYASDGATVNQGANQAVTAHSVCRRVTNNSTAGGVSIYIPLTTAAEWLSFYSNPPAGVSAGQCTNNMWGWGVGMLVGSTNSSELVPYNLLFGTNFSQVTGGENQSCGLTAAGVAYCWGNNYGGALGIGTLTGYYYSPQAVVGNHVFTRISAGRDHTCGIDTAGQAWCWGNNDNSFGGQGATGYGQLGDGTGTDRGTPVAVGGGHIFTQIAGGDTFTCALKANGSAWCWGYNAFGAIGDGTLTTRFSPVAVIGGHVFAKIDTSGRHVCGLKANGTMYCWGHNQDGQLGDNTVTSRSSPVAVSGGHIFTDFSTGVHTCGLKSNGEAWCWGDNSGLSAGALGDGTQTDRRIPVMVVGGHSFTKIRAAYWHTCALKANGSAWCWGYNGNGQLGNGTTAQSNVPVQANGSGVYTALHGGNSSTLVLTNP